MTINPIRYQSLRNAPAASFGASPLRNAMAQQASAPALNTTPANPGVPAPFTPQMPEFVNFSKKRQGPNPFPYQPRFDWTQFQGYMKALEGQQVNAADLYRLKANAITGNTRAEEDAVAGDIVANRLGPAFAAQYRARQAQNTSAALGQAAGASDIEARDTNASILSLLLQSVLGQAGVFTDESAARYGHQGSLLQYLLGGL